MFFLLLTACGEDATFRRWERAWEQAPKGLYPAAADEVIPSAEAVHKELEQYRLLAESFQEINGSRHSCVLPESYESVSIFVSDLFIVNQSNIAL